ncbi:hypothetical protein QWY84_18345 [Aquisalimonas lutea]|uniref:hypothetical protein n=1 Tax=Aquisalimonas lutea TaxID=1327750 RepID=UPI0025B466B2|nr:hypothetical protein [Aquisalimonas lutea]MDN3519572.1 hypothetical protein [Aquisalimonas lutea]
MADSCNDEQASADLEAMAHRIILQKQHEWLSLLSDALDELQPPQVPTPDPGGEVGLAFGFNLVNNLYPHVQPDLATTTANLLRGGLSRAALPIFLISKAQAEFARQHAADIRDVNQRLNRQFGEFTAEIYNAASDSVDATGTAGSHLDPELYQLLRDAMVREAEATVSRPTDQIAETEARMRRLIDKAGLIETDKDMVEARVRAAFNPIAERIELIARNSPANRHLDWTQRRLAYAASGDQVWRTTISGFGYTTYEWDRITDQEHARYLMKQAYKMEVKEVTYYSQGAPIRETQVINRMPSREPADLVPQLGDTRTELQADLAQASSA